MIPGNKHPRRYLLRLDEGVWTRLRILNGVLGGSLASTIRLILRVGIDEVSRKAERK